MESDLPCLREIVKQYGLLKNTGYSKKLGQNFLLDESIPQKIVSMLHNIKNTNVLEIGPGPGGLTREILKKKPQFLKVIEHDLNCVKALQGLLNWSDVRLEIIHGDATKKEILEIFSGEPFQIVANLPYNISTVLLTQWMRCLYKISSITVMVQREVAERIVAGIQNKSYGRLSILCQWMCDIRILFDVPPYVFTPSPKVFSSVIQFIPKSDSHKKLSLISNLERLTHIAFSKRRKMIKSSIGTLFSKKHFDICLETLQIKETLRPEDLTVDQFVYLAQQLCI